MTFRADTISRMTGAAVLAAFAAPVASAQDVSPYASVANSTALIGLAVVVAYYAAVWVIVGNRRIFGERKVRPMPPTDLAPAALRHVMRMGYDEKTLAIALMNMAVKGYLYIEETETGWAVVRDEAGQHVLSPEELVIARFMFRGRERFELSWSNRRRIAVLQRRLRHTLEQEYGGAYFNANTVWRIVGLVISTVAFVATTIAVWQGGMWIGQGSELVNFFLGAVVFALGPSLILREVLRAREGNPGRFPITMGVVGFVCMIIGSGVMFDSFQVVYEIGLLMSLGALTLTVIANAVFIRLLPRYTQQGWGVVREARGYLRSLGSETIDLGKDNATPRTFETFLPYAAALDTEARWTALFGSVIDDGPRARRDGAGYAPVWYAGRRWGRQTPREFTEEIVHGLTAAVSNSGGPTRRDTGMLHAIRGRAEKLGSSKSSDTED